MRSEVHGRTKFGFKLVSSHLDKVGLLTLRCFLKNKTFPDLKVSSNQSEVDADKSSIKAWRLDS